jgi:acyl-coenzyme A thioesterase PaaI-like protein
MSRVVVINHVTLDGVMQAPGRADEDTRDGFRHGGWSMPNMDEVMSAALQAAVRFDARVDRYSLTSIS